MSRLAPPTDIQVKHAKPKGKAYTLAVDNDMYLEITHAGAWHTARPTRKITALTLVNNNL